MDIMEAMQNRHSVRRYTEKVVEDELLSQLQEEVNACNAESGLNIRLVANDAETFSNLLSKVNFSGARNFFVIAGKKGESLEEKAGYYGERLVLKAQQLGLNSCWGASFSKKKFAAQLAEDEKVVFVISFGYGVTQGSARKSKPLVAAEVRVDFAEYVPEGFGTCDCVMLGGDTLDIVDYKHGKGVPVAAEGNAQMRLYALGALLKYEPFYGGMIQNVRMTIVQPRIQDVPSSETLTVDALKAWGESVKPIAQKAFSGFGEFVPGDHCRFCRGKAQCRARAAANTALEDFKDCLLPTPEFQLTRP